MKVLVISDTHGYLKNVNILLPRLIPMGVEHVIHCGDHLRDAKWIQSEYPQITVHMVPGNCDGYSIEEERNKLITIEGIPIFFTHGDRHHVKYEYEELLIDAKAHSAKIAIFGHTHEAYKEYREGIYLLNPGSITQPRDTANPSYAILDIQDKSIKNIAILQLFMDGTTAFHPWF